MLLQLLRDGRREPGSIAEMSVVGPAARSRAGNGERQDDMGMAVGTNRREYQGSRPQ